VSNPPAAVLNKQANPILSVAEPTSATLATLKAHFTDLAAAVVTVATAGRTKFVNVISGYLNALPPSWVSVGQNATLVSRRTPSLLATAVPLGTMTKGIAYHLSVLTTSVASLTRDTVTHLVSLLATQDSLAVLAQMPLRTFLASQPQTPVVRIGYPVYVTSTAGQAAFLSWLFLPSTSPVLNPLNAGALTLAPSPEGRALFPSGSLYPGTFIYPSLGLSLTVSTDGSLTLEPL